MYKYFGWWLLFCGGWIEQAAADNLLIIGSIEGGQGQLIRLEINKKYLNNTIEEYSTRVNDEGRFGFVAMVEFAQTVVLRYGGKALELLVAPMDTLVIEAQAAMFPQRVQFSGNAGADNRCWQRYKQHYAPDVPLFEQVNYKKGIYYYQLQDRLDSVMRHTSPIPFLIQLEKDRQARYTWLEQERELIRPDCAAFVRADIHYTYWYRRLSYAHIYRYRHQLEAAHFAVFDTLSGFEDAALGNASYREFVMAWTNYHYEKNVSVPPPPTPVLYRGAYELAKERLGGKTRYFVMAYLVEKALRSEQWESVMPLYEDFLQANPFLELDKIVTDAFQRVRPFAVGTPAPTFHLEDTAGNAVSLRDYQGKTIYLGFWASWCRPCLQKMKELETLKQALADQDQTVFIHISLDRERAQWRETLAKNQFSGIHLIALPPSTVVDDYKVLSVPKFFVITREGNFGQTPQTTDIAELKQVLSN